MTMKWIVVVCLTFMLSSLSPVSAQTDITTCDLFYVLQPVEHFTCNPYSESFGMRIECLIYYTSRIPSNLTIYWYRLLEEENSTNGDQPELVNQFQTQRSLFGVGGNLLRARFRISSIDIDEHHAGRYWCQAVGLREDDASVVELSYEPSQKIHLRSPSHYTNFPSCSNDYLSTQISTCAINGVSLGPPTDAPVTSEATTPLTTDAITSSLTTTRFDSTTETSPPLQTISQSTSSRMTDSTDGITIGDLPTDSAQTVEGSMNVMKIEDDDDLPLWVYAAIAGAGVAVLITVVCSLLLVTVICLWQRERRKYLPRSSKCESQNKPTSTSPSPQSSEKLPALILSLSCPSDEPSNPNNKHEPCTDSEAARFESPEGSKPQGIEAMEDTNLSAPAEVETNFQDSNTDVQVVSESSPAVKVSEEVKEDAITDQKEDEPSA